MDGYHFFADLSGLEQNLNLPSGFLERLVEEDDWSFLIKSHAVVEAALTHLITSRADPSLRPLFLRLPLEGRFSEIHLRTMPERLAARRAVGEARSRSASSRGFIVE